MKKQYHFNRQRRQLIHLGKRIATLRAAGLAESAKQAERFQTLLNKLAPRLGAGGLRRALGASALALGLSFGATAQVADFNSAPVSNPFGLTQQLSDSSYYARHVLADLDGDGDLDLLTTNSSSGTDADGDYFLTTDWAYAENIGTAQAPEFDTPVLNPFGLTSLTSGESVSLVDLDNDGDLDILEAGFNFGIDSLEDGDPVILYHVNTGSATAPSFAAPLLNPFGLPVPVSEINLLLINTGDLDGDGDLDILGQVYDEDADPYSDILGFRTFYYENETEMDGPIEFAAPVAFPFGLDSITDVQLYDALVDIDGDGDLDIVGTQFNAVYSEDEEEDDTYFNQILFVENTGDAANPEFGAPEVGSSFGLDTLNMSAYITRFAFGDLDGDGDLDMLTNTYESGFAYYRNGFPVSTREFAVALEATVAPNPTTGLIAITTDSRLAGIDVYDGMGRRVTRFSGDVQRLDLSALAPGTYTLQLLLPDGRFGVRRIVKD